MKKKEKTKKSDSLIESNKKLDLEVRNLNFWIRRIMRQKSEDAKLKVFNEGKHLLRKTSPFKKNQ